MLDDGVKPLIALELSDCSTFKMTGDHPFWVDGGANLDHPGWLEAGQLRPGDRLRTADGRGVTVLAVHWNAGEAHVYTLTVAKDHTFFVGPAHVLVHNADGYSACRFLGGSYKLLTDFWGGTGIRGEAHHLLAGFVLPQALYDRGPAILMSIADHRLTESWGRFRSSAVYRNTQAVALDEGRTLDALYRDVTSIRGAFNSKYDVAIDEALTYSASAFNLGDLRLLGWRGSVGEWAKAVGDMRSGLQLKTE